MTSRSREVPRRREPSVAISRDGSRERSREGGLQLALPEDIKAKDAKAKRDLEREEALRGETIGALSKLPDGRLSKEERRKKRKDLLEKLDVLAVPVVPSEEAKKDAYDPTNKRDPTAYLLSEKKYLEDKGKRQKKELEACRKDPETKYLFAESETGACDVADDELKQIMEDLQKENEGRLRRIAELNTRRNRARENYTLLHQSDTKLEQKIPHLLTELRVKMCEMEGRRNSDQNRFKRNIEALKRDCRREEETLNRTTADIKQKIVVKSAEVKMLGEAEEERKAAEIAATEEREEDELWQD